MTKPCSHAALAQDRHKTPAAGAVEHRLRRHARLGVDPAAAPRLRWIARVGAMLMSRVNEGTLRRSVIGIPAETTRESSLAAWIDSLPEFSQRDTSAVLIRPIDSSDGPLLADGFARLSPRSRQLRFMGGKKSLSPAELDHLTNVDHRDAEALVALSTADGRGIGVARYTRDPNDPQAAEVAVTVIDEWHRRGIGTELITRLIARAQNEDIQRFTALIANENTASINLLHSLNLDIAVLERDHGTTEYEIELTR